MAEQVRLGHTEMHPEQSSHLFCQVPMHELARGGFFAHSKERPLYVISQEYRALGHKDLRTSGRIPAALSEATVEI